MKSVHKGTRLELSVAFDALREAAQALVDERAEVAAELEGLAARVNEKVRAYNEAVSAYNEQIDGVVEEIDDYVADRSDRWREGEKGEQFAAWREQVEQARVDEAEEEDEIALAQDDPVAPEDLPPLTLDDVNL